jgi:hypothetical protein
MNLSAVLYFGPKLRQGLKPIFILLLFGTTKVVP